MAIAKEQTLNSFTRKTNEDLNDNLNGIDVKCSNKSSININNDNVHNNKFNNENGRQIQVNINDDSKVIKINNGKTKIINTIQTPLNNAVNNVEKKNLNSSTGRKASIKWLHSERFLRAKKFLKGICLALLSALFFSITTLLVKYVPHISPGTTAGFRYFGIILLSFPLALESKEPLFGRGMALFWIALRGLAGGTSVFFRYSALKYISMTESTIIILSMPVFVFLFARIFLNEQFGRLHFLALITSIVGIIFASNPDDLIQNFFNHHNAMKNATANIISNDTEIEIPMPMVDIATNKNFPFLSDQLIGTLYSIGSTLIGCFVYIILRKLHDVNKCVILFNFSIISLIEMIIIDYVFFGFKLPTNGYSPYIIFLIGIFSFYAQLLLTRALQIEEAGVVSVIRTSGEAFFAFFFQIIFFGEIPTLFTIFGACLVLSAVFLLSIRKYIQGLPEDDLTRIKLKFLLK